ncbi:Pr6Pr family membrane protein [Bifidobacterium saguinibicoloris]|uniref:Pr6Pr family membrane protein n=1 Tax=Bifidobacterium saguinibicoloris TaxID=2834433 RepID=UPI001C570E59|nr:Pr6Pr family membrane protein [Bifidobacterium saguinibicoloris]MBW3080192.1 Pr6Pr family membrane protein [Bifidobacterium saguinibicoloris]
MRFIVGLFRLAIAAMCFMGTYEAWSKPEYWTYFTFQAGFALGFVMLWSGAATILKGIQPPAWLKGCVTVYAVITAAVAFVMMPPDDPAYVPAVLGLMTNTWLHRVAPILAVADFLLFDPHRRFPWHYMFSWLAYFPVYLAFVVIRAALWPTAGPAAGGNPYPYAFIDLKALGLIQFGINCFQLALAFLGIGLVTFLIDRILPAKPLVG